LTNGILCGLLLDSVLQKKEMSVPYIVDDYMPISSEIGEIESLLQNVPKSDVIVRIALESRLESAQNAVDHITNLENGVMVDV